MSRFTDRIALVTGAASGIGRAVATRLLEEGADVYGVDLVPPVEDAGFECFLSDVSNEAAVQEILGQIRARHGRLDALVNAAGVLTHGPRTPVSGQSVEQWEAVLRTNLASVMLMMKHAHKLLAGSPEAAIVNVSAAAAFKSQRRCAPYAASKAGINALTRVAALEMAEDGIRVNAVAPGETRTGLLQSLAMDEARAAAHYAEAGAGVPLGVAEPGDVAGLICFLLSPEARRITGSVVLADGGASLG